MCIGFKRTSKDIGPSEPRQKLGFPSVDLRAALPSADHIGPAISDMEMGPGMRETLGQEIGPGMREKLGQKMGPGMRETLG